MHCNSIKIVKSSWCHNIEIAEQGVPRLKTQVVIQNLQVKDEIFWLICKIKKYKLFNVFEINCKKRDLLSS
jgi:hypothetical protein